MILSTHTMTMLIVKLQGSCTEINVELAYNVHINRYFCPFPYIVTGSFKVCNFYIRKLIHIPVLIHKGHYFKYYIFQTKTNNRQFITKVSSLGRPPDDTRPFQS